MESEISKGLGSRIPGGCDQQEDPACAIGHGGLFGYLSWKKTMVTDLS